MALQFQYPKRKFRQKFLVLGIQNGFTGTQNSGIPRNFSGFKCQILDLKTKMSYLMRYFLLIKIDNQHNLKVSRFIFAVFPIVTLAVLPEAKQAKIYAELGFRKVSF